MTRIKTQEINMMIPRITIKDLNYEINGKPLFSNLSLSLSQKEIKILAGPNGAGKSVLLKIISGNIQVPENEKNQVQISGNIIYLNQEIGFYDYSVHDWLYTKLGLREIEEQMHKLTEEMKKYPNNHNLLEQYGLLSETFNNLDGYNSELNFQKAIKLLNKYGSDGDYMDFDLNQNVNTLSGGQKQKLKLLLLTLSFNHDFVLMDEIDTQLDEQGIEVLMKIINNIKNKVGIIVVTHNRNIADQISNTTLYLDPEKHTIQEYNLTLSEVILIKEREEQKREAQLANLDRQGKKIKIKLSQHSQPKKKHQKQHDNDKLARNFKQSQAEKHDAKTRRHLQEALEKISKQKEDLKPNKKIYEIAFKFEQTPMKKRLTFSIPEDELLSTTSGCIAPQDKILLEGKNGAGKTYFLNKLFNELIKKLPSGCRIFYIKQERLEQNDKNVWDYIKDQLSQSGTTAEEGYIRSILVKFDITTEKLRQKINTLSAGERTRLMFALINIIQPNLLILDEPTIFIDIEAILALENGLKSFQGACIVVTHDQQLKTNVPFNKTWKVQKDNKIKLLFNNELPRSLLRGILLD